MLDHAKIARHTFPGFQFGIVRIDTYRLNLNE